MAVGTFDPIVSRRFAQGDAHQLDAYERSGGYEGLKAAVTRPPQEIVEEVKTASLLGRAIEPEAGGYLLGHGVISLDPSDTAAVASHYGNLGPTAAASTRSPPSGTKHEGACTQKRQRKLHPPKYTM